MPLLFSYGSNSPTQLSERIGRRVKGSAAYLPAHGRYFRGWSRRWEGGVATVLPNEDLTVYGYVANVTPDELHILDRREGVLMRRPSYKRIRKRVYVRKGRDYVPKYAQIYVSLSTEHYPPSTAYHEAVVKTISAFWQGKEGRITKKDVPVRNPTDSYDDCVSSYVFDDVEAGTWVMLLHLSSRKERTSLRCCAHAGPVLTLGVDSLPNGNGMLKYFDPSTNKIGYWDCRDVAYVGYSKVDDLQENMKEEYAKASKVFQDQLKTFTYMEREPNPAYAKWLHGLRVRLNPAQTPAEEDATFDLFNQMQRQAQSLVRRGSKADIGGVQVDDLVSKGSEIFTEYIVRSDFNILDPSDQKRMMQEITSRMRDEIEKITGGGMTQRGGQIQAIRKVSSAQDKFRKEYFRDPTTVELIELTGMKRSTVEDALMGMMGRDIAFDEPLIGEEGETSRLEERIGTRELAPDVVVAKMGREEQREQYRKMVSKRIEGYWKQNQIENYLRYLILWAHQMGGHSFREITTNIRSGKATGQRSTISEAQVKRFYNQALEKVRKELQNVE